MREIRLAAAEHFERHHRQHIVDRHDHRNHHRRQNQLIAAKDIGYDGNPHDNKVTPKNRLNHRAARLGVLAEPHHDSHRQRVDRQHCQHAKGHQLPLYRAADILPI